MAAENPLAHVIQHPILQAEVGRSFVTPEGKVTLLSDQITMMIVGGLLLTLFVPPLLRRRRSEDPIGRLVPTGFGNALEAICEYLRKEVAEQVLQHHAPRFVGYIWSVFFFVLTVNLLGLLPLAPIGHLAHTYLGGAATGNIWVTATLAILTLILMVVNGLRFGGMDYIRHFNPGPLWLAWLLVPLEIVGTVSRIFALTVRLFANMMAGHILLTVLLGFILSGFELMGSAKGFLLAVPVVLGSVAINMLEILVAVLQAFIFAFLTALFIGMSILVRHEEHGEGTAEAQAH